MLPGATSSSYPRMGVLGLLVSSSSIRHGAAQIVLHRPPLSPHMRWRRRCCTVCQLPLLPLPPLHPLPPPHLLPPPQAVTSLPHRLPSLVCAVQLRPHHLDECAQQRGQEEVHQPGGEPTVTAGPASATLLKRCAEAWNGMAGRALRSSTAGASGHCCVIGMWKLGHMPVGQASTCLLLPPLFTLAGEDHLPAARRPALDHRRHVPH